MTFTAAEAVLSKRQPGVNPQTTQTQLLAFSLLVIVPTIEPGTVQTTIATLPNES